MPRFTKAQIARRQRIAALLLGAVVLFIMGGAAIALTKALVGAVPDAPGADPSRITPHRANLGAMRLAPTAADAAAHAQLLDGVSLEEGEVMGIDVSSHQGTIEWSKVKADGFSFAYIKATEGSGYTDPEFARNWKEARASGITTGAYHYFTLCSSGEAQARDFLATAPVSDDALPPALDLEFDGACEKRPEAERAHQEIADFLDLVEKAWGRRVVIYSSYDWRAHYGLPQADNRPEWLFDGEARPEISDWAVWQQHFEGTVSGIKGRVDIDVAREEQLREQSRIAR